jgi:hypothetical protein
MGSMKKLSTEKIEITQRALFQRVARKLRQDGKHLRSARVGHHFIVAGNKVIAQNVNLETLGRKLGVIQPWEKVA